MKLPGKWFIGLLPVCFSLMLLSASAIETPLAIRLGPGERQSYRIVTNQELINEWQGIVLARGETIASGEIQTKVDIDEECMLIVFLGNRFFRIWMMPGESLAIREDASGKTIFEGKAALHNSFMVNANLSSPVSLPAGFSENFQPDALDKFLDQTEADRQQLFKDFNQKINPSRLFTAYVQGEVSGFNAFTRAQYPMSFIYQKKSLQYKDIPGSYFDFWNNFKILEDGLGADMYMNAVRNYIAYLALSNAGFDESDREKLMAAELRIGDSILKNHPVTRQKLQAVQIDFLVKYFSYDSLTQSAIADYTTAFPGSAYNSFLNDKWARKKNVLMTKMDFRLRDATGKMVDISQYRGKLVYVDFWGSWCKACIVQFDHSKKLQQQFAGKDIVFLFIDFYDDDTKWKSAITKYQLKGEHLKAEKNNEAFFNEKFGIGNGFPRYALIDQQGILRSISAPHPNDPAIIRYLNSFL